MQTDPAAYETGQVGVDRELMRLRRLFGDRPELLAAIGRIIDESQAI